MAMRACRSVVCEPEDVLVVEKLVVDRCHHSTVQDTKATKHAVMQEMGIDLLQPKPDCHEACHHLVSAKKLHHGCFLAQS